MSSFKYIGVANKYYTEKHDWVEFNGTTAYIGVSDFKLTGITQIDSIEFIKELSDADKDELVGYIHAAEYKLPFYIPFDGKLISYNEQLLSNPEKLRSIGEDSSWLIKVAPRAPYSREGLLMANQYMQKIASGLKYE